MVFVFSIIIIQLVVTSMTYFILILIFQILYLTDPESWTAASVYQATRIFASNLNAKMAQRYFNLVLFPRIRDDIGEYKRLNYHLYMALKKSLFKPAAFFKGILLPLCEVTYVLDLY